jgi:hypothetical protein
MKKIVYNISLCFFFINTSIAQSIEFNYVRLDDSTVILNFANASNQEFLIPLEYIYGCSGVDDTLRLDIIDTHVYDEKLIYGYKNFNGMNFFSYIQLKGIPPDTVLVSKEGLWVNQTILSDYTKIGKGIYNLRIHRLIQYDQYTNYVKVVFFKSDFQKVYDKLKKNVDSYTLSDLQTMIYFNSYFVISKVYKNVSSFSNY